MTKQKCDKCGKKYSLTEGLFTYSGLSWSKWRRMDGKNRPKEPSGEKAICKYCKNKK